MSRAEVDCVIANELGLHLRAAAEFVKVAERYASEISLMRDGESVSGKSIIALVTLAAPKGSKVTVVAEGTDANEAAGALSQLIRDRFGEDS